jgi:hypothetical protein
VTETSSHVNSIHKRAVHSFTPPRLMHAAKQPAGWPATCAGTLANKEQPD